MTNDAAREILFWNAESATVANPMVHRDTSGPRGRALGWPVQGVWGRPRRQPRGGKRILHDLHEIGASGFMDRHWREDSRWRAAARAAGRGLSKSSMRQSAAEAAHA